MSGFIPKEKMSKKARKALDNRQRLTWPKSPALRTIESKKTYNRKRESHDCRNEESWDFIFVILFKPQLIKPRSSPRAKWHQSVNRCLLILRANLLRRTGAAAQESLRG